MDTDDGRALGTMLERRIPRGHASAVAAHVGLSDSTVKAWRRGERAPTREALEQVIGFLPASDTENDALRAAWARATSRHVADPLLTELDRARSRILDLEHRAATAEQVALDPDERALVVALRGWQNRGRAGVARALAHVVRDLVPAGARRDVPATEPDLVTLLRGILHRERPRGEADGSQAERVRTLAAVARGLAPHAPTLDQLDPHPDDLGPEVERDGVSFMHGTVVHAGDGYPFADDDGLDAPRTVIVTAGAVRVDLPGVRVELAGSPGSARVLVSGAAVTSEQVAAVEGNHEHVTLGWTDPESPGAIREVELRCVAVAFVGVPLALANIRGWPFGALAFAER